MPANKAGRALMARVEDIARDYFGGDRHYLARAVFGNLIMDDHLAVLEGFDANRMETSETVRTLMELSKLVDCVQDGGPQLVGPERGKGYFSERYPEFARKIEFAPTPLTDAERQVHARAMALLFEDSELLIKSADYALFTRSRTDLEFKRIELLERRRQAGQAEGVAGEALALEIAELEELIATIEAAVEALDRANGFEAAEEVRKRCERKVGAMPAQAKIALDLIDQFKFTDISSNETHVMGLFFPSGLDEDNWTPLHLAGRELLSTETDDDPILPLEDLLPLDGAKIETLEMEMQMLSVERPWFWPELFENHQWQLPRGANSISDGQGTGQLPAYVQGLVFGRNLRVHGTVPDTPSGVAIFNPRIQVLTARPSIVMKQGVGTKKTKNPFVATTMMTSTAFGRQTQRTRGAKAAAPMMQQRAMNTMVKFNPGIMTTMVMPRLSKSPFRLVATNGQPIGSARITVRAGRKSKPVTVLSDGQGRFTLPMLIKTRYQLTAAKPGFEPLRITVIANTRLQTLRMVPIRQSHRLVIQLKDMLDRPFEGDAQILLKQVGGRDPVWRETANGRSELDITLKAGTFDMAITSAGARRVLPERQQLVMNQDRSITVKIDTGLLISIPEVQLLGFICKSVPRAPDPLPELFS